MASAHAGFFQAQAFSRFRARRARPTKHFSRDCGAFRRAPRRRSSSSMTRVLHRRKSGAKFVERPGEIVAVVVERIVGVLAGVKAALALVGERFVDPVDDAFGGFAQERIQRDLPAVQIISQQLRIVVRHFLEVRNEPSFVHRVAMEAAGELIVDAAARHFVERAFRRSRADAFLWFADSARAQDRSQTNAGILATRPKPPFLMSNCCVTDLICAVTTSGSNAARAPVKTSACATASTSELAARSRSARLFLYASATERRTRLNPGRPN